jgi:hypothetical protein
MMGEPEHPQRVPRISVTRRPPWDLMRNGNMGAEMEGHREGEDNSEHEVPREDPDMESDPRTHKAEERRCTSLENAHNCT